MPQFVGISFAGAATGPLIVGFRGRTSGGRRLRRLIQNLEDERITNAIAARAWSIVLRRLLLPELKRRLRPALRTGRLIRSLIVTQREAEVFIEGNFYGHFVRVGGTPGQPGKTIEEMVLEIVDGLRNELETQARIEMRRLVGRL